MTTLQCDQLSLSNMAGDQPPILHFTSAEHANPGTSEDPFSRLVRRLEAATSRLEDIASSSGTIEQQANGSISAASGAGMPTSNSMPDLPKGGSREASTGTVVRSAHENGDGSATAAAPKEELPERIEEMDSLIETKVKDYVEASRGLDPLVEEQVRLDLSGLLNQAPAKTLLGIWSAKSFHASTAVSLCLDQVQEARFSGQVDGPVDRSAARYGRSERDQRYKSINQAERASGYGW